MSVIPLLLNVLGPVVAIIAVGALAGRRLGIEIQSLSRLAYWVLGPAFVFDLFASTDLAGSIAFRLIAAGIAGSLAAGIFTLSTNRFSSSTPSEKAADLMTSVYGNVGNTGLAVSVFALGEDILPAAGVLMVTINVIGMSTGVGLAASQTVGVSTALKRALLAPMTVAAAVAVPINLASLTVPTLADRSIGLLAGALIPVMLFTLGMQLNEAGGWSPTPGLTASAVAKLIVAPIGAVAVGSALGLAGDNLGVVAIQSAMPPAVFCLIVAREHGLEPARVTANVVALTLLSLLTLPVVLILFAS